MNLILRDKCSSSSFVRHLGNRLRFWPSQGCHLGAYAFSSLLSSLSCCPSKLNMTFCDIGWIVEWSYYRNGHRCGFYNSKRPQCPRYYRAFPVSLLVFRYRSFYASWLANKVRLDGKSQKRNSFYICLLITNLKITGHPYSISLSSQLTKHKL